MQTDKRTLNNDISQENIRAPVTTNHWKHRVQRGIEARDRRTNTHCSEYENSFICFSAVEFLNPHASHRRPALTKYLASNCAAEVFLSLLLWSYRLMFAAVFTDSLLTVRPTENLRARGRCFHGQFEALSSYSSFSEGDSSRRAHLPLKICFCLCCSDQREPHTEDFTGSGPAHTLWI